ncbi:hypothetical protein FRC19_006347 [Serendipita sp. 401]|nr:hypothetical protein FRC19_006347 [Serendipita sp. 401]
MSFGHQGSWNIPRNQTWAPPQGQSPFSGGKEEEQFSMDIGSPGSFNPNAIFGSASMGSPLDASPSPSLVGAFPSPYSPTSNAIPFLLDTHSFGNNVPKQSLLSQQLLNHQSQMQPMVYIDPALINDHSPSDGYPHTRNGSLSTDPGLSLSPSSQRCDSVGTPASSCSHHAGSSSAHLRQNSAGSQTMSIWSRSHSILGAGGETTGLVSSPTSPFFDHSCLLSPGSYISSPLATGDSGTNGLLMTMDKVPTTPMEIPGGRKQPTRRLSRASGSSGSLSTGLLRSSLASMNRPHPYVPHTRQLSSPSYSTTGLAQWTPSNHDQHSAPSFDANLEMYLEDLSADVLSSPGSAPVTSILDPRPQSQSRRRTKAQGEGFQEGALTSLDEFTPSQLPAAIAIINYQQQHPGTPIPTAFITSELAEIKDGKGRCLVGSCASSTAAPKRADHLHEHIRDRHFNCKPYRCEDCTQSFSREHDLKRHHSVHRRDQSPCPVCSNTYSRVDNLKRHVQTKHPTFDMQLSSSAGARSSTRSTSVITSSSMF